MVISVAIAVVAMTIWFFFFAGSSLPQRHRRADLAVPM